MLQRRWLVAQKISVYSVSSTEALSDWCGLSEADARDLLRDVVLNHESFDLPITGLTLGTPHVAHIRIIRTERDQNAVSTNAVSPPFEILGVLMEFLDVSRLHQSHRWFEDITAHFAQKLRNDLEAVSLAWQRVGPALGKTRASDVIDRRLVDAARSISIIQDHVEQTLHWDQSGIVPLDARICAQQAAQILQSAAAGAPVEIKLQMPAFVDLVFARHAELVDVFSAALRVLIDDVVAGGKIEVTAQSRPDSRAPAVEFTFRNEGYGMPLHHVESAMLAAASVRPGEQDALGLLAERANAVERWGADVKVNAEVGMGFEIIIRLRSLQL